MTREITTYMFFSAFLGPWIGPVVAYAALAMQEPEQKILGVVVPFKPRLSR